MFWVFHENELIRDVLSQGLGAVIQLNVGMRWVLATQQKSKPDIPWCWKSSCCWQGSEDNYLGKEANEHKLYGLWPWLSLCSAYVNSDRFSLQINHGRDKIVKVWDTNTHEKTTETSENKGSKPLNEGKNFFFFFSEIWLSNLRSLDWVW